MPGTSIGPYSVIDRLGAGGMGEVYLAEDPRLGRRVALKTVSSSSIGSVDARAGLLREAMAAAKLNHPNIAAVYDVLDHDDGLHIVMEYVEGESAAALIRRGQVPVEKVVHIGIQLLDALDDAHAHGVLHRDIKPGNVMITPQGRVKVLDFGLAKIAQPGTPRRRSESAEARVVVGTPGYLAPERLLHREADHRADLYAAGALVFEMLTGRLPHEELDSPAQTVLAMTQPPPAPAALNPQVPPALSAVVLRALASEPDDRYGSAAEFRCDLAAVAGNLAERATGPVSADLPGPERSSSRPARAALSRVGGPLVAAAAAIAVWIVWTLASRPPPAQAFGERDWVLIADFDNLTAEPIFDHTLRVTLETALQQSRYLNVFPRSQAFDALKRIRAADTSRVGEGPALEIAKRENIRVVLAGSALASGSTFQLAVRALDASTGNLLFAETRRFSRREDLFEEVDSLAMAVRQELGERVLGSASPAQPLARVTTTSLEALQLYSRANDEYARGGLEKSRDLLQAALKLDPEFAMAHLRLGAVFSSLGQFERTAHHYDRAYALRGSVTERESYVIQSKHYEIRDEFEKARDSWRILTQLYPDDLTARLELGIALHETGEFEEAVPELRHALTLNPYHGSAHARLVLLLARIGRADEAVSAYDAAASKGVENPFLLWGVGLARMARLEHETAREVFTRLGGSGEAYRSLADLYLAQLETYEGKLAAARQRVEAGLVLDEKSGNLAYELLRRYFLGRILLLQQQRAPAGLQAQAILERGKPHLLAQNLYQAGTLYVRAGDAGAARQVLQRLVQLHAEMPTPFHRTRLDLIRGELALAQGNVSEAQAAFQSAANGYPGAEAHEGLAATHMRRQDWSSAREEWQRVIGLRGNILQTGFAADWPLAHLAQANVCRQAGDIECARQHYETFIGLWQRGDASAARREAGAALLQLHSR